MSDGSCEMILPYDASWPDARNDILKDVHPAERKDFTHGIPDRTLGSLIYQLSKVKGDNIVSRAWPEEMLYKS